MANIYVGNLLYATTEADLVEFFSQWGAVERATLVYDRETGRPRGFAFVEMEDSGEASKAVELSHGAELNGRPLTVNEARPRGSGKSGPVGGNASANADQPAAAPAGYGNSIHPPTTNAAPPASDLPKDEDLEPVSAFPQADEPVKRSGGYTNYVLR
ncbi:MAG: hypothetical protein V3V20_07880 [Algisphaera sp.]